MELMAFNSVKSIQGLSRPNTKQKFILSPIRKTLRHDAIAFGKKVVILSDETEEEEVKVDSFFTKRSSVTKAIVKDKIELVKSKAGKLKAGFLNAFCSEIITATVTGMAKLDNSKVGKLKAGSLDADMSEITTATITGKVGLFWKSTVGKLFAHDDVSLDRVESIKTELHMIGETPFRNLSICMTPVAKLDASKPKLYLNKKALQTLFIHTQDGERSILDRFDFLWERETLGILERLKLLWKCGAKLSESDIANKIKVVKFCTYV